VLYVPFSVADIVSHGSLEVAVQLPSVPPLELHTSTDWDGAGVLVAETPVNGRLDG
jgi:hypothetical protein